MIRNLILSAVVATGTLTGLTLTPTAADAHTPVEYHHRRFEVLVHSWHHGWQIHGTYHDRFDAEQAARHLRHEGFRVEIREF
ncbi:MAG: hypothetical protein JWO38_4086 [Gemmataceae bacterium]|nr:hypothetical protein [Gemmataceae bacterium]